MDEKTEKYFPHTSASGEQELNNSACSELFKDAYAGLLNDPHIRTLNFENLFDLSSEFSPEQLFKEST